MLDLSDEVFVAVNYRDRSLVAKPGLAVKEFLQHVDVLAWNSEAAQHDAHLRVALEESR